MFFILQFDFQLRNKFEFLLIKEEKNIRTKNDPMFWKVDIQKLDSLFALVQNSPYHELYEGCPICGLISSHPNNENNVEIEDIGMLDKILEVKINNVQGGTDVIQEISEIQDEVCCMIYYSEILLISHMSVQSIY